MMADQHAPVDGRSDRELEPGARAEEATAMVKDEARDLKAQGEDAARQVKQAAQGEIERRSNNLADGLDSVGRAMRLAAEDLEGEGQDWLADYTRRAAGQVERVGRYLHDEDAPAMLTDLEEMARSNPGTFLGTSFAAGVAAGRFLRSSRPKHERQGRGRRDDADRGRDRYGKDAFDQVDQGPTIGGVHHETGMSSHPTGATSWDEHPNPPEHERRQ
jgi:plasmid stabilization system protein ParE